MVSAIPLCLLAIGLTIVSSQSLPNDDFVETPSSERRTFSHKKPVKVLPVFKKHKKFAGIIPHHVFSKVPSTEIIYHEAPKPVYKYHRYQGIEVKPVSDVSYSTPEPIVETHSIEPSVEDFGPGFGSDDSFAPASGSSFLLHPEHDKPIFSAPPVHAPLPSPPKPIFSYVPAPPQPVLSPISIVSIPAPAFPPVSIARPALNPIQSFPPVLAPASIPSLPRPSIPVSIPSLPQAPIPVSIPSLPRPTIPPSIANLPQPPIPASFPSNPLPSVPVSFPASPLPPQPIFPIKIPVPVLPPAPAPSPVPSFSSVKIPAPVQPLLPAPSPSPVLPSISAVSPTPVPAFPPVPVSLPPVQFSVIPSTLPPLPAFHPPSISATPEPEFPYPPSGVPAQSYIKDISLGDVEIKDTPLPTVEAPKYEEVTPTIADVGTKDLDLSAIRTGSGFFQKIKGWKADMANTALSFAHFKPIPTTFDPHPTKPPVELPVPHVPSLPNFQLPGQIHPLPLAPSTVFVPPSHFNPPHKYESFPPNNIEPPPLLNSYGVPIPHNSYAPAHISHDRLSSAASEEQPSVVQAPAEKQEQNQETQQQTSQSPFQPQAIPHDHPIYVPEENKTVKEDKTEDVQPEAANEANQQDEAPNALKYPNHKE